MSRAGDTAETETVKLPLPGFTVKWGDTDLFPIRDDVNWAELGESMGLGGAPWGHLTWSGSQERLLGREDP